jgi:hypothetical protein
MARARHVAVAVFLADGLNIRKNNIDIGKLSPLLRVHTTAVIMYTIHDCDLVIGRYRI